MRRLLGLVIAGVLALGLSACDVTPSAATAGSVTITTSQLDAQLGEISGSDYARCTLQIEGENLPTPLQGAGDNTYNTAFADAELATLVINGLVEQDLAKHHAAVSSSQIDAARADFEAELQTSSQSGSPCPQQLQGAALVARLPRPFLADQVRALAGQELLAETLGHVDVSTAALMRYYTANPDQFHQLCLSDIAVATQAQAQSIRTAITSGSSTFAQEAQNSLDAATAGNGGVVGCLSISQIANQVILNAVNSLPQGQISPPVFVPPTGSGGGNAWFLLQVNDRPVIPFDQAAPSIRLQLLSSQRTLVSAEFTRLIRASHVIVDPRYGTWNPSQGVVPPPGLPARDLLSPASDLPSGSVFSGVA
ncbi:MAG: peptidylprolyl isomerase [Acidimicrobiales bacterium]